MESGLQLASQRGLSKVTLGDLATHAGLSKSGLFAHFASKDELQIKLIDAAEHALVEHVVVPCHELEPGLPKLRAIVERWLGWSQAAGLPGGCPLYAAVFELDDSPGPARDHLLRRHDAWIEQLTALTGEAIAAGHLAADTEPAQVVHQLEGIYLAHHLAERFSHDPDATHRAKRALDALLVPTARDRTEGQT